MPLKLFQISDGILRSIVISLYIFFLMYTLLTEVVRYYDECEKDLYPEKN